MSTHNVIYYDNGKKTEKIIKDIVKIEKEKNLLKFTSDNGTEYTWVMSDVLSYKKVGE